MTGFSSQNQADTTPDRRQCDQGRRRANNCFVSQSAKELEVAVELHFLEQIKHASKRALWGTNGPESRSGDDDEMLDYIVDMEESQREMVEYLNEVSDEDGGGDGEEARQAPARCRMPPSNTGEVSKEDSDGGGATDDSLEYLDVKMNGPWDNDDLEKGEVDSTVEISSPQDPSFAGGENDPISEQDGMPEVTGTGQRRKPPPLRLELQGSDQPTIHAARGRRCGTPRSNDVNADILSPSSASAAASIDVKKIPKPIVLRSHRVADKIIQKIAFKKTIQSKHAEEPTVLYALERRIKNAKRNFSGKWGSSTLFDIMLIETMKSPRWSLGISEAGNIEKEAHDMGGSSALKMEASLYGGLEPFKICRRIFVEEEGLVVDLGNSGIGGFDTTSLLQVIQWNGLQIMMLLRSGKQCTTSGLPSPRMGQTALSLAGSTLDKNQLCKLHATKIILQDNLLNDKDVALLAMGLREVHHVKYLDLSRNKEITWKAAAVLGELLDTISLVQHYRKFDIDSASTGVLPGTCLEHLDLSDTRIGDRGTQLLCDKLIFNDSLKFLALGHCNITKKGASGLGWLMHENSVLEVLKLGWNRIGGEGASEISQGLRATAALRSVDLSHNGLGDTGGSHIGYALTENQSLKELDLSNNDIGSKACLVIAEAISRNRRLEVILLNHNPLGGDGGHHLLHALADNTTLKRIGLQGSSFLETKADLGATFFNRRNPNGHFKLDLQDPAQRQVAIELVRLREIQGAGTWQQVKIDGQPFELIANYDWSKRLPERGMLELVFVSAEAPSVGVEPMDKTDFESILQELSDKRANDFWRLAILRVLTGTFFFSSLQAGVILKTFDWRLEKLEAAIVLFGRVVDTQNIDVMTREFTAAELRQLYAMLGILAFFRPENPTGRYNLDLSRQLDRVVLARLLEISIEEGFWRRNSTWMNFRNVFVDKNEVIIDNPSKYEAPRSGITQFDFVSLGQVMNKPLPLPGQKVEPMSDYMFYQLLEVVRSLSMVEKKMKENSGEEMNESPRQSPKGRRGSKFGRNTMETKLSGESTAGTGDAHPQHPSNDATSPDLPACFNRRRRVAIQPARAGSQACDVIREHMANLEQLRISGISPSEAWRQLLEKMGSMGVVSEEFVSVWDTDMPTLTPLEIIKAFSTKAHVTCQQLVELLKIVKIFTNGDASAKHFKLRVEVVQTLFSRIVDLDRFTLVLRELSPTEQTAVQRRMGVLNVIPLNRMDLMHLNLLHFRLRLSREDEAMLCETLCEMAGGIAGQVFQDLVVNAERCVVPEGANMFHTITVIARERPVPEKTWDPNGTVSFRIEYPSKWLRNRAAIHIQAAYRGYASRRDVARHRLENVGDIHK